MEYRNWVRLPSNWINERGLTQLQWGRDSLGSSNTAALMALIAIAHKADESEGIARLTYDRLCSATGLSRAKLASGLGVLERIEVVRRCPTGQSTYQLVGFNPQRGWAKLPAKSMYSNGGIAAFKDFRLRKMAELDAMKLFLLFIARRSQQINMAKVGYDRIEYYTGVPRPRIKAGLSMLTSVPLIHVECIPSAANGNGVANAYRIVGIDPYRHMGTTGRGMDSLDFEQA